MILQIIIDIYTYITGYLFPQNEPDEEKHVSFKKNNDIVEATVTIKPMDRSLDAYDDKSYIQQFGQPFANLDIDKFEKSNKQLVNKPVNIRATNTKPKNNKSLAKTHSWCPGTYYCGYCSKHIPVPIHLYLDKAYCTISCRNKQYELDRSNQVRQTHSFSV